MKEFLKKLNNFRLSAVIMACGAAIGVIATLLFFVFYQISGVKYDPVVEAEVATIAFQDRQVIGMWFFVLGIISLIIGIYVIYSCMPYILAKEKLQPNRAIGFALAGQNLLLLVLVVFAFLAIATEVTRVAAGWSIGIALATLSILFAGAWIYPNVKCNFYCPEVKID